MIHWPTHFAKERRLMRTFEKRTTPKRAEAMARTLACRPLPRATRLIMEARLRKGGFFRTADGFRRVDSLRTALSGTTGTPTTDRRLLIVPVVALVTGVLHAVNAAGPEYCPSHVLAAAPERWASRPVTYGHPSDLNGNKVSIDAPGQRDATWIGTIIKSWCDGTRLLMTVAIDPNRCELLGATDVLDALRSGQRLDVSVGAMVTTDKIAGIHGDKAYSEVWTSITACDHLAVVPKGACDQAAGCYMGSDVSHVNTNTGDRIMAGKNDDNDYTPPSGYDPPAPSVADRKRERDQLGGYAADVYKMRREQNAEKREGENR